MGSGVKAGLMVAAVAGVSLALTGAGWTQTRGAGMRVAVSRPRANFTRTVATSFHANSAPQVPGLGFDYVHLAAVGGPPKLTFSRGARNQFITPIFTGLVPFYSAIEDEPSYTEPQPSVVVVQQLPQTIVVQQPASQNAAVPPPASAAGAIPEDPPDIGEFIFLRRDGQVVFAVAFTTANDLLTYITRQGVRRSFPMSELDKDATLQMNEANGTMLVLPD